MNSYSRPIVLLCWIAMVFLAICFWVGVVDVVRWIFS